MTTSTQLAGEQSGLADLFGLGRPSAVHAEPMEVRLGVIGRGHAGKTALFRALYQGVVQENLPSHLQFDVEDPMATARLVRDSRATIEMLHAQGLPTTVEPEELVFHLFEAEERRAAFRCREVVGQILTQTTNDSSPEDKARYADYVAHLAGSDVQWVVVSCPPKQGAPVDLARYEDDLLVTKSYLREALRCRTNARPSSVALLMTKVDSLFDSEEEGRSRLPDDRLFEVLRPLANMVLTSDKVANAAIFPVSAFGFGNAVPRSAAPEAAKRGSEAGRFSRAEEANELEWILKPGATPTPFNLTPLVVWTLLCGMLFQEVTVDEDDASIMARIGALLRDDFATLDGWCLPLKGMGLPKKD